MVDGIQKFVVTACKVVFGFKFCDAFGNSHFFACFACGATELSDSWLCLAVYSPDVSGPYCGVGCTE